MNKKIVWGIVLFALIGLLVAGAVVRTVAKTGDVTETRRRSGDGAGTGQAQVDEWLTLEGSVVSVDADALVVRTTEGEQVVVENRPWWFAQEQGFTARPGDQVALTGFYEEDTVEVGQVVNLTSGQSVQLRDDSGRPMWAGRGRRSG